MDIAPGPIIGPPGGPEGGGIHLNCDKVSGYNDHFQVTIRVNFHKCNKSYKQYALNQQWAFGTTKFKGIPET